MTFPRIQASIEINGRKVVRERDKCYIVMKIRNLRSSMLVLTLTQKIHILNKINSFVFRLTDTNSNIVKQIQIWYTLCWDISWTNDINAIGKTGTRHRRDIGKTSSPILWMLLSPLSLPTIFSFCRVCHWKWLASVPNMLYLLLSIY